MRSWLEILFQRTGIGVDIREIRAARLIYDSGKKLELDTAAGRVVFWAAIWDPRAVSALMALFRDRGIPTDAKWGPGVEKQGEH